MSFRSAWLIKQACADMESPMAPLISALGTRAAESTTPGRPRQAHQRVGDLKGLLAGVGLAHQQLIRLDVESAYVGHIQRVLGVDEGGDATGALGLGDQVERQGRLAAGLRTVDLDDASAGDAADAGHVDAEAACGDRLDVLKQHLIFESRRAPLPKCSTVDNAVSMARCSASLSMIWLVGVILVLFSCHGTCSSVWDLCRSCGFNVYRFDAASVVGYGDRALDFVYLQ